MDSNFNENGNCTFIVRNIRIPDVARIKDEIGGHRYELTPSNNLFRYGGIYENRHHIIPQPWRHMLNMNWREALTICQNRGYRMDMNIHTDIFNETSLFTYLSVTELKSVTDMLEMLGRAGGPLVVFTGFTVQQVRWKTKL